MRYMGTMLYVQCVFSCTSHLRVVNRAIETAVPPSFLFLFPLGRCSSDSLVVDCSGRQVTLVLQSGKIMTIQSNSEFTNYHRFVEQSKPPGFFHAPGTVSARGNPAHHPTILYISAFHSSQDCGTLTYIIRALMEG